MNTAGTILLLGGTGETAAIAEALLARGVSICISLATSTPLALPDHPQLRLRRGRLDGAGLVTLLKEESAVLLVDGSHPYAAAARENAQRAAAECHIPYLTYIRPPAIHTAPPDLEWVEAANHADAAVQACGYRAPILLTIGSRNLGVYVDAARAAGVPFHARILPGDESEAACSKMNLDQSQVTFARGPFGYEENLSLIRAHDIGVVVTKDGGGTGGLPEKLAAAHEAGCQVVIVARPPAPPGAVDSLPVLLAKAEEILA